MACLMIIHTRPTLAEAYLAINVLTANTCCLFSSNHCECVHKVLPQWHPRLQRDLVEQNIIDVLVYVSNDVWRVAQRKQSLPPASFVTQQVALHHSWTGAGELCGGLSKSISNLATLRILFARHLMTSLVFIGHLSARSVCSLKMCD